MSLRDGIKIDSYSDLIKTTNVSIFFEPNGDRVFTYNTTFDCPGMVNIETGEPFYGKDIQKFITFPLHCVHLMPFTQEEMDAP